MTPRLLVILAACTALLGGCVERVDAPLAVDRELAAQAGRWLPAGTFGGPAALAVESADPWERRYEPGGFEIIAGVDSTAAEVWVCDLGISRVQVFDYDGNFLRSLGSGIPTRGTAPDDHAILQHMIELGSTETPFEKTPEGQRWIGSEREHFIAADVHVDDNSYVICDQAHTGIERHAKRSAGLVRIPFDDAQPVVRFPQFETGWPSYVAGQDGYYAASDPLRNAVVLFAPARKEGAREHVLGGNATMQDVLGALHAPGDYPLPYQDLLQRASKASGAPGSFYGPSGVAIAFDKLVVCDTNNRRLQVFEVRADEQYYWGKLLRIIEAVTDEGRPRFGKPLDIDIAPDGRVYLLDAERQELVELSPTFDRLGVIADGFGDAHAVDLSPDGNHLFVIDRSGDKVHHYVRAQ